MFKRLVVIVLVIGFCSVFTLEQCKAATMSMPPNSMGLVDHWTFDGKDISGTTVYDVSGSGNNGTMVNSPAKTMGILGQALHFTSANSQTVNFTPNVSSLPITMSIWVSRRDTEGEEQDFFTLSGGGWIRMGSNDSNSWSFESSSGGANSSSCSVTNSSKWNHYVLVATTTGFYQYSNGVRCGYAPNAHGFSGGDISSLTLGRIGNLDGYSLYVNGSLDDPRIYNRALSDTEVRALYNAGSAKFGKLVPQGGLANGLVGYWTFDGGDVTDKVYDRSGSGNNGYIYNAATSTIKTIGRFGEALQFDGSSHRYVEISNNGAFERTGDYTVSLWATSVYPAPAWSTAFCLTTSTSSNSLVIQQGSNSGFLRVYLTDTPGNVTSVNMAHMADGNFHNVTVILSGITLKVYFDGVLDSTFTDGHYALGAGNLHIGVDRFLVNDWKGKIDDVKIYNRAISQTEMTQLYAQGNSKLNGSRNTTGSSLDQGLVGLWSFDGKDVQPFIMDRSGNFNHGYYYGGATTTVIGKIGQAISVDGTIGKSVNLGRLSATEGVSNLSWSFWVKGDFINTSDNGCFVCKADPNFGTAESWEIRKIYNGVQGTSRDVIVSILPASNSNDNISIAYTSGESLVNNQWNHVAVVFDGTQTGNSNRLNVYVNGVAQTLGFGSGYTVPASTLASSLDTYVGKAPDTTRPFTGGVDELRIYNRTLSAAEVKKLYLMGR